jgi:hypothetical protein
MTWEEARRKAVEALDDYARTGLGVVERVALVLMEAAGAGSVELGLLRAKAHEIRCTCFAEQSSLTCPRHKDEAR